jgi:SAM-dependent methyltransferase
MSKWVRTPKHILRMAAVRHMVKGFSPGTFIECGAGTGDFTRYFLEIGYKGSVYDIDKETLQILADNLKGYKNVTILDNIDTLPEDSFDYLFAFEVLEHIPDDRLALQTWTKLIREKGTIVVSVPAHQRKFSNEDSRVGHIRRYEKDSLFELLSGAGYENIRIVNYGFPLGNITRLGKNTINALKTDPAATHMTQKASSIESGIKRDTLESKLQFLFNRKTMALFLRLQKHFYQSDLGDGYVVTATKSPRN